MCTETNEPHKHAELILAWAKGAKIEWFDEGVCVCGRRQGPLCGMLI